MKKTWMAVVVLALFSVTALADSGKKPKKEKSKAVCGANCPVTKDCKPTAKCPSRPGCVCD